MKEECVIYYGFTQKISPLHINGKSSSNSRSGITVNFETTWHEFIAWDGILRSLNMSRVPYCLLSFFTSRITNSRYFFNSIPSNSIGSSSVFVIRCFFSLVILVTVFCISISIRCHSLSPLVKQTGLQSGNILDILIVVLV
jgi:hypothetical protein